jgi:hypothetical protein
VGCIVHRLGGEGGAGAGAAAASATGAAGLPTLLASLHVVAETRLFMLLLDLDLPPAPACALTVHDKGGGGSSAQGKGHGSLPLDTLPLADALIAAMVQGVRCVGGWASERASRAAKQM